MKWGRAGFVARLLAGVSRSLGITPAERGRATYGPVSTTEPKSRPCGPPPSIHARAVRVCNRNPKMVARYLDRHDALSRGR